MTIREIALSKLQQLPESALTEVSEFIDFMMYKHQSKIVNDPPSKDMAKAWDKWFEEVERLEVITDRQNKSEYQQLLLNKYRKQGLEL